MGHLINLKKKYPLLCNLLNRKNFLNGYLEKLPSVFDVLVKINVPLSKQNILRSPWFKYMEANFSNLFENHKFVYLPNRSYSEFKWLVAGNREIS